MPDVAVIAARLTALQEIGYPWPHGILDDFLPAGVFSELLTSLPDWNGEQRTRKFPASVAEIFTALEPTIRQRWGFTGGEVSLELTHRVHGAKPHCDRADKNWSGIVYVAGHPTGTELFDASDKITQVEFKPNRLLCWGHCGQKHAVPKSPGRFAIQWWFIRGKPCQ